MTEARRDTSRPALPGGGKTPYVRPAKRGCGVLIRAAAAGESLRNREARMRITRELRERATFAVTPIIVLAAKSPVPNVVPDASKAPGGQGLQDAINVFAFYGILAAIAGFLLGGAVWAVGGRGGNEYAAQGGKVGMAVAVGVAFLIGAASAIIKFAFDAGGT
jgi:hypothetical protein